MPQAYPFSNHFSNPVEDIPWDTIFKKFNDSRKRIFIFDDLERCSLPINEILGYINSLVEHESEKVLIVANQQAIRKMSLRNDLEAKYQVVLNPQLHLTEKVRKVSQSYFTSQDKLADQHITEFTPDQLRQHTAELFSENVLYKEIKEKLVGQELYFRPTLEKTLPCIIDESSLDDEVKEVLTQSLDKILNVFQQENCLNLRSFQAALLTLIRIWNLPFDKSINPLDRQQLLEDLFVAILHSTIQQKKGGHRYKWDDGKSYAQCSYSKRALAFTGYFLGFKFVEDYIFESTLNSENVVSTINTYVQNEITKPREKSYDPIQKTTQFWLMTDSAVEDLYNDRKLVAVRTECRAFILGVVDLCLVAVQNFTEAAALALHVAKAVEHIGQRSARHPPCRKSARRPACSQKHLRSCTSFWAFYLKRRFLVVFGCFTDQVLDIHLFRPPFARNIGAFIIQPGGGSLQS